MWVSIANLSKSNDPAVEGNVSIKLWVVSESSKSSDWSKSETFLLKFCNASYSKLKQSSSVDFISLFCDSEKKNKTNFFLQKIKKVKKNSLYSPAKSEKKNLKYSIFSWSLPSCPQK